MRRTKTVALGEPSRTVTIRELTVANMRNWLKNLESSKEKDVDFVSEGLMDDVSLSDLVLMTDIALDDFDGLVPSKIEALIAACREVNPHFFSLRERLTRMWKMAVQAAQSPPISQP